MTEQELRNCSVADLERIAAEAHETEIAARVELHERGKTMSVAQRMIGQPAWKTRIVEALEPQRGRTFSKTALTIALLFMALMAAPAFAKFGGAMVDKYLEAKQLQQIGTP
jgi:hypothetical protein